MIINLNLINTPHKIIHHLKFIIMPFYDLKIVEKLDLIILEKININ